jgi:hypothetical protein
MDGGTPTKDPPKRGPLIAARAGAEPPDGERRPYAESGELRRVFGSAQPTEERGSAPGRGIGSPTPTGHTRTSPFRKLRYRLVGAPSTSGCGPTRSRERWPRFIGIRRNPPPALRSGRPLLVLLNRSGGRQVASLLRLTT